MRYWYSDVIEMHCCGILSCGFNSNLVLSIYCTGVIVMIDRSVCFAPFIYIAFEMSLLVGA